MINLKYSPKLSIIIPTKNRQMYLMSCVKSILKNGKNIFEIIVQDNSDKPILKEQIEALHDERIIYSYCNEAISFCDNFEKAVSLSSGDYLTIIGDDDSVLPSLFDLVVIVRELDIDCVTYSTPSNYLWANSLKNANDGTIFIRKTMPKVSIVSSKHSVERMFKTGDFDYQKYFFPKVYHGLIRRSKMDEYKMTTGKYFGGLTPDIYSAVSLSFVVKRHIHINYPFTLPGMCAKSGSADSLSGRHTGKLKDAPHFTGHDNYLWDSEIPYVYSVQTIWAETAFKALKDNGVTSTFNNNELFAFLCTTLKQCPVFFEEFIDYYARKTGLKKSMVKKMMKRHVFSIKLKYKIKKMISFAKQLLRGRFVYSGVSDISNAIDIVMKKLKKFNIVFKKIKKLNFTDADN